MSETEVKQVFSCTPFRSEGGSAPEYEMITHGLKGMRDAQEKATDLLYDIKNIQDLITLNQECQKKINNLINSDGTLDGQKFKETMQDLRSTLKHKMAVEKQELEKQAATNPRAQKFLDQLPSKFQPLFDFIENTAASGHQIIKENKIFSKEQVSRLTANIDMDLEDANKSFTITLNKISAVNNEIHEKHQNANTLRQTHHAIMMGFAKNVRG